MVTKPQKFEEHNVGLVHPETAYTEPPICSLPPPTLYKKDVFDGASYVRRYSFRLLFMHAQNCWKSPIFPVSFGECTAYSVNSALNYCCSVQ